MALPTTNLTVHFNASDNDQVWKNYQAGSPFHVNNAVDGDNSEVWNDEGDGSVTNIALVWGASWNHAGTSAKSPTYRTATPLMPLSCLDFDGSTERLFTFLDNVETNWLLLDQLVTVSAKTVIIAFYIEGIAANAGGVYDLESIISGNNGSFGIGLRSTGYIVGYNFDGNYDAVELSVTQNATHFVTLRHDGTNLYMSLDGGSESSVASGNTNSVNVQLNVGCNYNELKFFNGRIGEMAFYNVALTGTPLSDANAYFTGKWLAAAPTAKPHHYYQQMRRMAA